jgi:hypothetical protein
MNQATSALLAAAFGSEHHPLAIWYATLLDANAVLREITAANAPKIRKKSRRAITPDDQRDLRCELAVAALLADRRSPLTYEPTAAELRRGPDFLLQHKGHTPVYAEVSRLRPATSPERDPRERLAAVISGKLRQLAPSAPNLLALVNDDAPLSESDVGAAITGLRRRADAKDDAFFAFRGLAGARELFRQLPLLAAVLVATTSQPAQVVYLLPGARHPLPPDLARTLATRNLAALVGPLAPPGESKLPGE